MANLEHTALNSSQVHEPKHITNAGTADAGQVITPSSSTAGESTLRRLVESEVNDKISYLTMFFDDLSTAKTLYLASPMAGVITNVQSVLQDAITGADAVLTVSIGGVNVSPATITITQSGSAAGDVDSVAPTSARTVAVGDTIEVATDGGDTAGTAAYITFTIQRTNS